MSPTEKNILLFLVFFLMLGLGIRIHGSMKKNAVQEQKNPETIPSKRMHMDLNKASLEDLEKLPGVGPKLARTILQYKEKCGSFSNLEELQKVKGIGKGRYNNMRKYLFIRDVKKSK